MLRGDASADRPDKDAAISNSLDFGRAMGQLGTSDDSGPMWGPGVKVQGTPAEIISRNLHIWRNNNIEAPAAKAAEELDKLYASLPEEVFDLTFQDMIDRNNPVKQRSPAREDNAVKNYGVVSPEKSSNVNPKMFPKENGQVKHASNFKENKNSGNLGSYSIDSFAAKLRTMAQSPKTVFGRSGSSRKVTVLSPETVHLSPRNGQLSDPQRLDKPVEKRTAKLPVMRKREQLYSVPTTPTTSLHRESGTPTTSFRRESTFPSSRSSFSDSGFQMDTLRHSINGRELEKPARYLDSHLETDSSWMSPANGTSPRRQSLQSPNHYGPRNPGLLFPNHYHGSGTPSHQLANHFGSRTPSPGPFPNHYGSRPPSPGHLPNQYESRTPSPVQMLSNQYGSRTPSAAQVMSNQYGSKTPSQGQLLSKHHKSQTPSRSTLVHTSSSDFDCSSCSATNLVLKISCLVCGRTFCLRCMDLETKDTPGGRKCKKTCLGRPVNGGFVSKGKKSSGKPGCWSLTFGVCTQIKIVE